MYRDFWALVASASFLSDGSGGGVLFVAPLFTDYHGFDAFRDLVFSGLRHLLSPRLKMRSYHPLHYAASCRAPVATLHVFLDSDTLYAFDEEPIDGENGGA